MPTLVLHIFPFEIHKRGINDVWCLDIIGKEGAFHKKLSFEGINTVIDLLRALNRDPQ